MDAETPGVVDLMTAAVAARDLALAARVEADLADDTYDRAVAAALAGGVGEDELAAVLGDDLGAALDQT